MIGQLKTGHVLGTLYMLWDLADAHSAALEFLQENKPQFISLNIGTGEGYSVLDVVQTFLKNVIVFIFPIKL